MTSNESRSRRVNQIMDAFADIKKTAPMMLYHLNKLDLYHHSTGDHILRVAFRSADTAIQLGLDPKRHGQNGLLHDLGKDHIALWALEGTFPNGTTVPSNLIQLFTRDPHMEWTRIRLKSLPKNEFVTGDQLTTMADVMNIHDYFPNRRAGDNYPRKHERPFSKKYIQRIPLTTEVVRGMLPLKLNDASDRFHNGWGGDNQKAHKAIIQELTDVVFSRSVPVAYEELDTMVRVVAQSTRDITKEDVNNLRSLLFSR